MPRGNYIIQRSCEECGKIFTPPTLMSKYCSPACSKRAYKKRQIAKEKDILTVVDEVQTGNGRTGRYFAYENYSIKPDIVSTAKGLAGGLPMGAVLFGEKVADCVTPSSHGSTFGGNPIAAAGAISIVKRIDDEFLQKVREKSKYITDFIKNIKGVKAITGMGLMLGIETDKQASDIAKQCLENGLLVLTAHKNRVRLCRRSISAMKK